MEVCTRFCTERRLCTLCTVCTGSLRDPLDLDFFKKYTSLGCEHLCTDGRLYTILHGKEAVYIVHGVYRPSERPLGFRFLKELYKFSL